MASAEQYVELDARSAFSFLQGASLPEELAALCAELGLPGMALVDGDGVYGAPRFHLAARKSGIRAHIGSTVTLGEGAGCEVREEEVRGAGCEVCGGGKVRGSRCEVRGEKQSAEGISHLDPHTAHLSFPSHLAPHTAHPSFPSHLEPAFPLEPYSRLPILVENRAGYQNLCRLITQMKMRARKGEGAAGIEEIAAHAAGLVCLTGGDDGPLARALENGGWDEALRAAEQLVRLFGPGNVYAELQRHFDRDEEARNQAVVEIARRLRLPLVATNGVRYGQPQQREILDVLTCVRHKTRLEAAGRLLARNAERHLKPAVEMARLFADLPEAVANTVALSARLGFTLDDLGYEFPRYPVPEGETMMSFLRQRTAEGARNRYGEAFGRAASRPGPGPAPLHERAHRQIERELALIDKLGLAGYFLIVWNLVQFCRRNGILAQGRGSAANSAVCYSLGITAVDPVGMDLLFERFLSEERGEWPDIDLDLPSGEQRERVIQYVYERYGRQGAAMTANVITYRGRSAAREVGKALGFDEETRARLAGLVAAFEWRDPRDTPERAFREAGLDLDNARIRKFLELYRAVQDLPRHLGQHSGGMVICQGRLDSVVPLEPAAMPGRVVVQWDKDDCAGLGIIKVDLLGLGMMAVLEDSIQLIRDSCGDQVDLAHLPAGDPAVYAALQKADTVGMFQVESRAQMACLPRLRPERFYDIVVQVAIIRPGPIVGKMVNPFIKRRQGREPADCLHPTLEPVLRRTLGVPLFQEQLLRMAMIAAGFTGGEAEELRRAFGFKRSERRMAEIEVKLRAGMERKGITGKTQDSIINSITSFALYGFPESHAASFALIAYASAWLKCHYLAAFTAALLNNQPMGFYQPATLIKDAQRHGLKFLPADVTRSGWLCSIEDDKETGHRGTESQSKQEKDLSLCLCDSVANPSHSRKCVRLGLCYVKGLCEEAARAIIREREARPFASVAELARRVPELRRDELRKLAEAGALNYLGGGSEASERNSHSGTESQRKEETSLSLCLCDSVANPSKARKAPQLRHRRDALWDTERAARPAGPLLEQIPDPHAASPLAAMSGEERLNADFRRTGLTLGRHPMAHRREELNDLGVTRAGDLRYLANGREVRIAGIVICRQRPGTAKGFLFLSLEDETGIANAIVTPDLFDNLRLTLVNAPVLLIDGVLQNQDSVISVKAKAVGPLPERGALPPSHDFH